MVEIYHDGVLQEKHVGFKSSSFASPTGSSGTFYAFGYYEAPAGDVTISNASATHTLGSANEARGAHAFLVASGAGTASGGAGAVEIVVTGTSINDAGVRNAAGSEVIVADITTMTTDAYYETNLKWIGQVVYTIQPAGAGTHTTFESTYNYGLAKYEDFGNRDLLLTDFEVTGRAGANDTGPNFELLHHKSTGWTYDAAAFVPGDGGICDMQTDYNTEYEFSIGENFAYKRASLSTVVHGADSEGLIVRITTTANKSIDIANIHVGGIYSERS